MIMDIKEIKKEIKETLEAIYGPQEILPLRIYEINGHVVEFNFTKNELAFYGSTKFGILIWDAMDVDVDGNEFVYGVEIGGDVVNGRTRVYKLQVINDVITDVGYTKYWLPVLPLTVNDILIRSSKRGNTNGFVWLRDLHYDKTEWTTEAIKLDDKIIREEIRNDVPIFICQKYKLYWYANNRIGKPGKVVKADTTELYSFR